MAVSEAQKRANARYRESGRVKQVSLKFFPKDHDLYDFVKSKDKSTAYILNLIREDMNRSV